jgi:hypothetical protein
MIKKVKSAFFTKNAGKFGEKDENNEIAVD